MGEYEPDDSRIITQNPSKTPIEPPRTGPSEHGARPGEKGAKTEEEPALSDPKENARWQVRKPDPAATEDEAKPRADS